MLTQYLLGQLNEADEERVELRLLSDQAFNDEFDVVVDEIAIRYVAGGLEGNEKEQVEKYFLRTPERQNKVRVIAELMHHSATAHGENPVENPVRVVPSEDPGFFARVTSLFRTRPMIPGLATVGMMVVIVGVVYLARPGGPPVQIYAVSLASTQAERGPDESTDIKSFKIPAGTTEVRVQLLLSQPQTQPKSYRAEFVAPATPRDLPVVSHDAQSVIVAVPATNLKPDHYAIRLFAVSTDGREERVPGSYRFRVE